AKLEDEMTGGPSLAMLFMDGDGSETSYREAHRALPRATRRVIEDPIYTDSKSSQLMQMADHVAWCANAAVAKLPKHAFAHGWYDQYLSVRALTGAPWPFEPSKKQLDPPDPHVWGRSAFLMIAHSGPLAE